jgi:hypothetical protein
MRNLDRYTMAAYGLLVVSTVLIAVSYVVPVTALDGTLMAGILGFFLGAAFVIGLLRPAKEDRDLPSFLPGVLGIVALLVLKYGEFRGSFGTAAGLTVLALAAAFFVTHSRASRRGT